jgi:hypothetical protein
MQKTVSPLDYGAHGDGNTDDSSFFQAALDSGYPVRVPYTFLGYSIGSTALRLYGGSEAAWQILEGDQGVRLMGTGSAILAVGGPNPHAPSTYGRYVKVSGFTFHMADAPSATSTAILLNSGANDGNSLAFNMYSGLLFQNCHCSITDVDNLVSPSPTFLTEIQFLDCKCWQVRGAPQVALNRTQGFILFRNFHIDLTQNMATLPPGIYAQFGAVRFGATDIPNALVGGLELERFDVNGGNTHPPSPEESGAILISGTPAQVAQSIWLRRVLVDSVRGYGIFIRYADNVFGVDVQSYAGTGFGVTLFETNNSYFVNISSVACGNPDDLPNEFVVDTFHNLEIANLRVDDNQGVGLRIASSTNCRFVNVGAHANTVHGIWIFGSFNIEITNARSDENTNVGLQLVDTLDSRFVSVQTYNNGGPYGISHLGTSDRNVTVNARVSWITGLGSLDQVGAQSATVDWIANGGTYIPASLGVTTVP